mmetsp:Transcript_6560/g.10376  ORF Transcript_6560/g.10376 Transcript_6560/m.10376 type:complete len:161 (+) Transcript_6560:614-1096(+)
MAAAKTLGKQLVRNREHTQRMQVTKGHMKGIANQMTVAASQQTMIGAMANAGKVMGKVNESMDPAQMAKMMGEFEKQNEMMDTKQEMMDDALDGLFDDDEIEEEADNVTQQVLDELGLDLSAKLATPSAQAPGIKNRVEEDPAAEMDELSARLAALKTPA